jgi:hypothetical protein
MQSLVKVFALLSVLFIACKKPENTIPANNTKIARTGKLIPVNLNDTLYGDFRSDFKETITSDGWKINYLVKDDSTKYKDIHIKWEKDRNVRTLNFPSVLIMRSYFLPVFKTETKTHLFLEHGCATSCSAVTALPKNPEADPHVFYNVLDYDINTGRVVYTPERSYSLDSFELDVFDLKSGQNKTIQFKNKCSLSPEDGCIEKVLFNSTTVELYGVFSDEYGKRITEKQTAKF